MTYPAEALMDLCYGGNTLVFILNNAYGDLDRLGYSSTCGDGYKNDSEIWDLSSPVTCQCSRGNGGKKVTAALGYQWQSECVWGDRRGRLTAQSISVSLNLDTAQRYYEVMEENDTAARQEADSGCMRMRFIPKASIDYAIRAACPSPGTSVKHK